MATVALNFSLISCGFAIRTAILAILSRFTVAGWMRALFIFGHKHSCSLDTGWPKRLLSGMWTPSAIVVGISILIPALGRRLPGCESLCRNLP